MSDIYVYGIEDTLKLVQVLLANDYEVSVTMHMGDDDEEDDEPVYIVNYEISQMAYDELGSS
jgi:hypothetical protein